MGIQEDQITAILDTIRELELKRQSLGDAMLEAMIAPLLEKLKAFGVELKPFSPGVDVNGVAVNGGAIPGDMIQVGDLNGLSNSTVVIGKNIFYLVMPQAQAQAPAGPTQAELHLAALHQSYLNRVVELSGALSLAGIDRKAAGESEARLSLGAVYTALLTLSTDERPEMGKRGEGMEGARRLSALEMLDRHERLVLLGDPGSGKTTFVNFVALCLAGEALGLEAANLKLLTAPLPAEDGGEGREARPQPWRHGALLPLRVLLRDFAARGLPPAGETATAKHLWAFIADELNAAELGGFVEPLHDELLRRGGLLLLDGLDEVPEAESRRVQIKQCVEDFARTFRKCRILVTSRIYAYQKQDWRLDGFTETTLAPFSKGQIARFVERWYAQAALLRHMNPADAQGRAVILQRAIFNSERLLGLAERPLLLTLMASLHAWRGGTLPERREELYADTVDLLLDWWESQRVVRDAAGQVKLMQPSLVEYLKVDRQKVRDLLNELAFKAHQSQPDLRGTADIAEGELVGGLMRLSNNPDAKLGQLVEYLSNRAGLLLPRGVAVYTFPHRTFQEYLAACYLTDHDYPDLAAELACKDVERWREVTLLAGAKAARGAAASIWTLADALCYRPVSEVQKSEVSQTSDFSLAAQWGALLAGQALAESAGAAQASERNRPKLERVQDWLRYILKSGSLPPVERAGAGDTLAMLGGLRFKEELWGLPEEALLGFVEIPEGPFRMGSDPKIDKQAYDDEKPQHELSLPTYYLARYPTTQAQFALFVRDGGYAQERYWGEAIQAGYWKAGEIHDGGNVRSAPVDYGPPGNLPHHPVVGVTWYEALAYCRWLNEAVGEYAREVISRSVDQSIRKRDDEIMRNEWAFWEGLAKGELAITLPSEAEWEKAACWQPDNGVRSTDYVVRGTANNVHRTTYNVQEGGMVGNKRIYPWGDEFDADKANTSETGLQMSSAVGCFPGGASGYGLLDMSGNVWEWTRSHWKGYPYDAADGREKLTAPANIPRVLRGGSFNYNALWSRCAARYRSSPNYRGGDLGFRVGVFCLSPCSVL